MLNTYTVGMEAEAGAAVVEDVALQPVSPHDFSAYPAHLLYSVRAAFFSNAERCASCVRYAAVFAQQLMLASTVPVFLRLPTF